MLPLLTLIFSISYCYAANITFNAANSNFDLSRELNLNNNLPHIFSRATSRDPSCPNGFLCEQQGCDGNIICPEGQICFNFEGTVACGDPGLTICALNPNTLEAVGCNGGTCCHGNCYTAGTVCCDFDSIQCEVGDLCNACKAGQTCGNNQCVGGGTNPPPPPPPPPPATTSKTTVKPPPPPPATTTSKTTAKPPPPATTTSKTTANPPPPPASSTTTGGGAAAPTLVSGSGSFSNIGCFVDLIDARVLVAGSSVDHSSTGMTVGKCISFASDGGFQFAGVEFGGECWVGNTVHDAVSASQSDCNQACDGNSRELCGASGRIQIYQDGDWFDPAADDLANALQQFNATLVQAQAAIDAYHTDIQALQSALQSGSRKRATITEIELEVLNDRSQIQTAQDSINQESEFIGRLFLRGASRDVSRGTEPIVDADTLDQLQQALEETSDALSDTAEAASEDADNINASTENLIDFQRDVTVSQSALSTIGIPGLAAVGIFFTIATLFSIFHSSGGGNGGGTVGVTVGGGGPTSSSCRTSTARDCQVGCSITNFGDTSFATNCFTTRCVTSTGCDVEGSTTTTETTTSLCPISRPPGTTWIPAPNVPLPFLGNDNVWTTPTGASQLRRDLPPMITIPPTYF
ncbi:WSC domain-containing protein [Xylogone sp. PMI_703]|nr:WSC domain-containing protein [Xylogone sp. PMI_703]